MYITDYDTVTNGDPITDATIDVASSLTSRAFPVNGLETMHGLGSELWAVRHYIACQC